MAVVCSRDICLLPSSSPLASLGFGSEDRAGNSSKLDTPILNLIAKVDLRTGRRKGPHLTFTMAVLR